VRKRAFLPESNSSTDSPASVRAGRLGRPHGLDGHLGLYVDSADLVYFEVGSTVHIQNDPYVVRSIRRADRGHHVAFEGVVSREDADRIRNEDVFVLERRVLGEEEFWPDQLVGLEARPSGGVVVGVVSGSAQDRLLVELDGETFEVPFVAALVPVIDLDSGFVEIVEMPGLIEPQGQ
jgi:16S rRNA processing protein RimM